MQAWNLFITVHNIQDHVYPAHMSWFVSMSINSGSTHYTTQIQWHLGTTVKRLALLDSRIWRTLKQIGWSFFSVFLCQLPTFSFLFFHDHQNSRCCTVCNEEGILRMLDKPTGTSGSLLVCGIEVTSVSARTYLN